MARVGALELRRETVDPTVEELTRSSYGILVTDKTPEGLRFDWLINYPDCYQDLQKLGSGGFGSVWKSFDIENQRIVAVKKQDFSESKRNVYFIHSEITALKRLHEKKTKYIPEYYTCFVIQEGQMTYFCIVMEFIEGSNMARRIDQIFHASKQTIGRRVAYKPVPEKYIIKFSIWLFETLDSIHKEGWAHKDIKPLNIVIDDLRQKFLLVDFGIACRMKYDDPDRCSYRDTSGTKQFIPPERYDKNRQERWDPNFDPKSDESMKLFAKGDMWAAALTIYYLITRRYPWTSDKDAVIRAESRDENFPIIVPYDWQTNAGAAVGTVIIRCLQVNYTKRPTAREASDYIKHYLLN